VTRKLPKALRPRWETPDPPGVTGTYGDAVIAWTQRELHITFGPWQAYVLRQALRHDKHGDLIARIALLSTGRQNGKSVIVRGLFGWLLDEGRCLPPFEGWTTLLAAAHDAKQARIIYKGVFSDLGKVPRLAAESKGLRAERNVRLTEHFGITVGGLTLDTVTGQPGSSRGLSAGAIIWDEVLEQKDWDMWESLSPTQSAQRSPIMLLTSTAGRLESVVLQAFYDRLRRQASGDEKPDPSFYGAWWESEDPDAGLDWRAIGQANPALGDGRLTRAAIQSEFQLLPRDSWRRERLNHFVDVVAPGAFNPGVWAACRLPGPLAGLEGPYALGIDVHQGWDRATISVAAQRPDGRTAVEVHRDIRPTEGNPITADRLVQEVLSFGDLEHVSVIAYDGVSGAAPGFRRHAAESGLPYEEIKRGDFVAACMDVAEMIQSGRLAVDDPLLDAQMPLVARRPVGLEGQFCFARGTSLGPIDAFLSMTFAAHAISTSEPVPQIW
jgi:hypothetical protein